VRIGWRAVYAGGIVKRWRQALESPRGPIWFASLAAVLSLPSLRLGLVADDHVFAEQVSSGRVPAWRLFELPAVVSAELRASGGMVWWASPRLSLRFLRPLASLTHWLEFRCYASSPWLMLLTNVVLYASCVGLCAALYRRLSPSVPVALLASWMFAIDEAHAGVVSWISARNSLLCAVFSFAALFTQIEARATRRRWLQVGSASCVALALASGESGVWALALLAAYAVSFEPRTLVARLTTIWPQSMVGAVWAAVYLGGGYGVRGSSLYRELSQPLTVLVQGVGDLPLWITTAFGPSFVSVLAMWPPATGRLATLPLALLLMWSLWPSLDRSPQCRFFAVSAVLGVVPLLATIPQDRLTMGIGFGAFGWLACYLVEVRSWWRHALFGLNAVLPLALFPLLLGGPTRRLEYAAQLLVAKQGAVRQVVLLNSPVEILNWYVRVLDPRPRSFHTLYTGGSELRVKRVAADALEVSAARGWGYAPLERVFCSRHDLPHAGEVRSVRDMRVEVLGSTEDGRPARVRFAFPTRLESAERSWLVWQGTAPVRWAPPALGTEVVLAAQPMTDTLPR
jgi:hypothetical protein